MFCSCGKNRVDTRLAGSDVAPLARCHYSSSPHRTVSSLRNPPALESVAVGPGSVRAWLHALLVNSACHHPSAAQHLCNRLAQSEVHARFEVGKCAYDSWVALYFLRKSTR